ncbi:hypothetical protein ACFFX0_31355 [Citricoccus parietis]|uniref:Secreted protein n=1 Tax=Citricoccus parietis TaxID=592307 RepID=A0ABV5G8Y5_9MICC
MTFVIAVAWLWTGRGVSRTCSLNGRRESRCCGVETRAPAGSKWFSAPRFSSVAGEKGVGLSLSTRCTSAGSSSSAIRRPGIRSWTGPVP